MLNMHRRNKFTTISKQREKEQMFVWMFTLMDELEAYINNLLKGQNICTIYVVIDVRVSKEVYRIVLDSLKKSDYKSRVRYCLASQVYRKKSNGNLYIILFDNPQLIQHLYLNKKFFLTLWHLSVRGQRESLIKMDIPPIFNTIENCYNQIGIYFTTPFGEKIFSYLKHNPYISVHRVNNEVKINEYGYMLERQYDIVLFLDLLESKRVFNMKTKKEYICLFWKNILSENNINYLQDVFLQIVPQLVKKQVKVIFVKPVNLRLNTYINEAVEESNVRDNGTKFLSIKERCRFNSKLIGDEKLGVAVVNTKTDMSKGYFRRFHVGDSYNFTNGFRVVNNVKDTASNNIYFFGSCISCSAWTRDQDTLCNQVAKKISNHYNVHSRTNNIENMNLIMRECSFKKNDIVVLFFDSSYKHYNLNNVYFFDLNKSLQSVPDLGKHMLDGMWEHLDKEAYKVLSKHIVDFLYEKNLISQKIIDENIAESDSFSLAHFGKRPMSVQMYEDNNFKKWLYKISILRKEGINGAIVMNCNPMTLGHMYLIEQAKTKVDNLYIFIVEEDSSEIPFLDRIDIVKNNLKNMENVFVLPSGKYVLSAVTLQGYFTKKDFHGMSIDASEDLELFLTIAQFMNITYRFVGSEPRDKFTRLYNEAMKEKLPQYGVEVIEIDRLQINYNYVSASDVRQYIAEKDWNAIQKIVPAYTYYYLMSFYQ